MDPLVSSAPMAVMGGEVTCTGVILALTGGLERKSQVRKEGVGMWEESHCNSMEAWH